MEIEYTDFIIYVLIFVFTMVGSIYFLDAISNHIFEKYASKFNEQIELYKKYSEKALNAKIEAINIQPMVQVEIIENFKHIDDEMQAINARINSLNRICEIREQLENEIVKLKNILKRKEKKS